MNTIYQKCKPKRKYKKLPPCGHRNEICDMEHCRLAYAFKVPKYFPKIDEYLHHRERVIKRRREIELQKLDTENCDECQFEEDHSQSCSKYKEYDFIGEYGKRKAQIKKYKMNFYWTLLILVGLVALYPVAIVIWDLLRS